jgi:hypothetical protein
MTTKLTLTIEESVIKMAKSYSRKKGRSLSELIENYLIALTSKEKSDVELSPRVKRMKGAIKLPKDFDYKKVLEEELTKKYAR